MMLATVNTGMFDFTVLGTDEAHCKRLLATAWKRHAQDYAHAEPGWMRELIRDGEVHFMPISVGAILRDGEAI